MNLQQRIELMIWLGEYIAGNEQEWVDAKVAAGKENGWFIPAFVDAACDAIAKNYLQKDILQKWAEHYKLDDNIVPKTVGLVMAGNIPLVGFHDFLSIFVSGHRQKIKLSTKDTVLWKHLLAKLTAKNRDIEMLVETSELLKDCDAYIATGTNNSSRYFEYYFARFPHVIRKNRTSVALITGKESPADLIRLADDINLYFGLGCRNVTKLYTPENYDFIPLLRALDKYIFLADYHKYKNNYDYQLAILLLNSQMYMTNGSVLLTENKELFSPISQVFYEQYDDYDVLLSKLKENTDVQCVVSNARGFGLAQTPSIMDYADGVDTMEFLLGL